MLRSIGLALRALLMSGEWRTQFIHTCIRPRLQELLHVFYNSLVPGGELAHSIRVIPACSSILSFPRLQFIHTLAQEGKSRLEDELSRW